MVDSGISDLLTAARPVTWRGKGDLLQTVWAVPPRRTWIVVELWAGFGGLALALLSTGMHFYSLAAECDDTAHHCSQAVMPHVVRVSQVESVKAVDFVPMLRRRKPRGVLLGGGSPCQGNSSLNLGRTGLEDPRSQQPLELRRLFQEFDELPEMESVELVGLLENVASMPKTVQDEYSAWLGCEPALIEAASCGWVHRRRFYWLFNRQRGLGPDMPLPQDWMWWLDGPVPEIRYVGKKPIPSRVSWEQGFRPVFDPAQVIKQSGQGAMHPFTREFYHPDDRTRFSTPEAVARFYEDTRRFPPASYEESSLLWKGDVWRQPTPDERSQLMGIPPAATSAVQGSETRRVQVRNSLLGNGFHLPSIMVLLCTLPSLCASKCPPSLQPLDEMALKMRLEGTIWESGRIQSFPGLKDAHAVCVDLQGAFSSFPIDSSVWPMLQHRLGACDLPQLQLYVAWMRMRGQPWKTLGPVPVQGRDKSLLLAGLGGQRYPGSSNRGLDHVLPPGLSKEDHIHQAKQLPNPFIPRDWPEMDIAFTVEALSVWGLALPRLAQKQRDIIRTVAKALAPLEQELNKHRSCSSRLVASSKQPGFVACMTSLLRWPDEAQARQLIMGYPIIGELADSGVFRSVLPDTPPDLQEWLGDAADEAMLDLCCKPPPRFAEEILAITRDEQEKGYCSHFLTKAELDEQFGRGAWRAFSRFLLVQPDGKKRAIDDARRSGHNRMTTLHETIHTVHLDFIASVASI